MNSMCHSAGKGHGGRAEGGEFVRRRICYEQFRAAAKDRGCRTISVHRRPLADESCWEYECSLREFIEKPVYPVWFVDEGRTSFLNYDNPEARPIRLEELARAGEPLGSEVAERLEDWYRRELGVPSRASFVVLHCAGCNRRVLIDGVHRALLLLRKDRLDVPVHVVELSGSKWPRCTPDLNVVCACRRENGCA